MTKQDYIETFNYFIHLKYLVLVLKEQWLQTSSSFERRKLQKTIAKYEEKYNLTLQKLLQHYYEEKVSLLVNQTNNPREARLFYEENVKKYIKLFPNFTIPKLSQNIQIICERLKIVFGIEYKKRKDHKK